MKEADRDRLPENQLQLSNSVWSPLITRRQIVFLNCLTKPQKTSLAHLPWLSTFTLRAPVPNCIHSTSGSSLRSAPGEIRPTIPSCNCWTTFPSHRVLTPGFEIHAIVEDPNATLESPWNCAVPFPTIFEVVLPLVNALCYIYSYTYSGTHNKLSIWNISYYRRAQVAGTAIRVTFPFRIFSRPAREVYKR